jgi:hypothetical protein
MSTFLGHRLEILAPLVEVHLLGLAGPVCTLKPDPESSFRRRAAAADSILG